MTEHLTTDVAIIGGGIMGCSAALHLRLKGVGVVLLEKGLCGSQASGVNMGGVRQQGRKYPELPISARSRKIWGRLPELIGEDCEFQPTGHLKVAWNEAHEEELEAYAKGAAEYGFELTLIGRNQLRSEYPWLSDAIKSGSLAPTDGQANPRLVAPAFARAALRAGADIRENCRVLSAGKDGDWFEVQAENGLVVRARHLLNVAGAWGGRISSMFGEDVPVDLRLPNMVVTEPVPKFMGVALGSCEVLVAARQVERGNIVFGGGGAGWGDIDQERARPQRTATLTALSRLGIAIPGVKYAMVIRSWSGLEGKTPDGIPIIGRSHTTENLLHAFAFCGHGFQMGPGVGEILAEMVTTGETVTPISAFDIGRFTKATSASTGAIQ